MRLRRVTLREGWWTHDNGPLLGRMAERPVAVALLPLPGGGYELVDPHERRQVRVDAEVAATVGHFAYTMYRPLARVRCGRYLCPSARWATLRDRHGALTPPPWRAGA